MTVSWPDDLCIIRCLSVNTEGSETDRKLEPYTPSINWEGLEPEGLLRKRGPRRTQVAELASCSVQTIYKLELRPEYDVSIELLRSVAHVLGAWIEITVKQRGMGQAARITAFGNDANPMC